MGSEHSLSPSLAGIRIVRSYIDPPTVAAPDGAAAFTSNGKVYQMRSGAWVQIGYANHDDFPDYVANEHIDHSTVTLTAGEALTGGGDITASRSFALDIPGLTQTNGADGANDKFVIYRNSLSGHRWMALQDNRQLSLSVRNDTGSWLNDGAAVYINGYSGASFKPTVALADANDASKAPAIGVVTQAFNTGSTGDVMIAGLNKTLATSGWAVGDALYLSTTAGDLTNTKPTDGMVQEIGTVTQVGGAFSGRIQIHVRPPITPKTRTVVEKSGAYTLTVFDEVVLADASGGAFTLTLPTAASASGQSFTIKKIDTSANAVTVDGDSAETIDGSTTAVLASAYDAIQIISDGTEYWIT